MDAVKIRRAGGTECLDALYVTRSGLAYSKSEETHVISNFFLFKTLRAAAQNFSSNKRHFF